MLTQSRWNLCCSSRSHLILTLTVVRADNISGVTSQGTLTLCDLAGSERISKTEAKGQRLVEAAAINKSLTALGQVWTSMPSRLCWSLSTVGWLLFSHVCLWNTVAITFTVTIMKFSTEHHKWWCWGVLNPVVCKSAIMMPHNVFCLLGIQRTEMQCYSCAFPKFKTHTSASAMPLWRCQGKKLNAALQPCISLQIQQFVNHEISQLLVLYFLPLPLSGLCVCECKSRLTKPSWNSEYAPVWLLNTSGDTWEGYTACHLNTKHQTRQIITLSICTQHVY